MTQRNTRMTDGDGFLASLTAFPQVLAVVRVIAVVAMLALAVGSSAAQRHPPGEDRCGRGNKVLCAEIRYCFFFCKTKEFYAGDKEN